MSAEIDYEDARAVEGSFEAGMAVTSYLKALVNSPETQSDLHITLHLRSKMGETEIDEFVFEMGSGETPESMAKKIVSSAEDDALEGMGKHKYSVRVDGFKKRCPFELKVPNHGGSAEDAEEFDEMPSNRGALHQMMRHQEAMFRLSFGAIKTANDQILQSNRTLQDENTFLKRHQGEQIKLTEQLRNMSFARELKHDEIRESRERKQRLMTMAEKALPVVAAKLFGGGAQMASEMGGGSSPVDPLIAGLVSSLEQKPEKLQALMQILDPIDVAAFAEIHRYVAQRREQEAQAAALVAVQRQQATQGGGQENQIPQQQFSDADTFQPRSYSSQGAQEPEEPPK